MCVCPRSAEADRNLGYAKASPSEAAPSPSPSSWLPTLVAEPQPLLMLPVRRCRPKVRRTGGASTTTGAGAPKSAVSGRGSVGGSDSVADGGAGGGATAPGAEAATASAAAAEACTWEAPARGGGQLRGVSGRPEGSGGGPIASYRGSKFLDFYKLANGGGGQDWASLGSDQ